MKLKKTIGHMALGALLVSLIPYYVQTDEKTGAMEVRSLLWAWRKTPRNDGKEKFSYDFAMPPSGLNAAEAAEAEANKEEAVAGEPA